MGNKTGGPPPAASPMPEDNAYMVIGTVVAPRGLYGEMWVKPAGDDPQRFLTLKELYLLHPKKGASLYTIKSVRLLAPPRQKRSGKNVQQALLSLEGLEDRTAVEVIIGCEVAIPLEEAAPLEADRYYYHQLIGLRVEDQTGVFLGEVTDIFPTPAHDIYVVRREGKEWYLPASKEIILKVDLKAGKLVAAPPPGLLEINE